MMVMMLYMDVEGGELGVGVGVSGMIKKGRGKSRRERGEKMEGEIILLFTMGPCPHK